MTGPRPVLRGIGAVLLAAVAVALFVEETPVPDWMVAPLLVPDTPGRADAIVVPGAGLVGPCVPNQNAFRRVLRAARELRGSRADFMVTTGGTGGDACRVGRAMADLAVEVGVAPERVRAEIASRSTYENAVMAVPLLRASGVRTVLLVTDQLHMARAAQVFRGQGFTVLTASVPIYESHGSNFSMLFAGLREYAALAYYRLRGWLGPDAGPEVAVTRGAGLPPPTGDGPIVLLGASYAAGWTLPDIAGVPVVNRGVAGQQSFELLARFERDVVASRPRAVIVWGFINDIFRAEPGAMDAAKARARESMSAMIGLARQHGITPILATEVTARPQVRSLRDRVAMLVGAVRGKLSYQDRVNVDVQELNAWVIETAARERLLLLDLQAVLAEPGGRRHPLYAQPDGSHITDDGYRALTTYARPILEEFLAAR